MSFETSFIQDTVKRLRYYKELGDKTFAQLEEKDFFFQPSEESNSIAIIVQHLYGNMRSRFTNFLTEDGEKSWRERDAEFGTNITTKAAVIAQWEEGWKIVFTAKENLQPQELTNTIYIRTEPLLVYDALLRQLAHYPYHIGQILYIGKMIKDAQWQSLSIAKGQSQQFNQQIKQGQ
ncbi:DUF1572 family protein [Limnovirga soli]|uniref:DUF1572 domain-containing protein n=1 Tax=Limnovirga soli TaxID=2656915 RepID=A0A8J8FH53_9BACT|nr:DUF1572 family protein [Limnovirga soli]NNV57975.1 DUF1572 domain-containing protein [Limnovirga soli]